MPELPEIYHLAEQMNGALSGATIRRIQVIQPKCLNMSVEDFTALLEGKRVEQVTSRGKWVFARLAEGTWLLLSLGMGGDAILHGNAESLPDKYQVRLDFQDGRVLTLGFWWFGYVHAATDRDLGSHKRTAKLGLTPIRDDGFTEEHFLGLLRGRKGAVKSFLLNQEQVAGIGNVYAQDTLFRARLHPGRGLQTLSEADRSLLYRSLMETLNEATALGGLAYEKDLYNQPRGLKEFLVGYREGQPCPVCGTAIEKIKTGSTSSYICSNCQK